MFSFSNQVPVCRPMDTICFKRFLAIFERRLRWNKDTESPSSSPTLERP